MTNHRHLRHGGQRGPDRPASPAPAAPHRKRPTAQRGTERRREPKSPNTPKGRVPRRETGPRHRARWPTSTSLPGDSPPSPRSTWTTAADQTPAHYRHQTSSDIRGARGAVPRAGGVRWLFRRFNQRLARPADLRPRGATRPTRDGGLRRGVPADSAPLDSITVVVSHKSSQHAVMVAATGCWSRRWMPRGDALPDPLGVPRRATDLEGRIRERRGIRGRPRPTASATPIASRSRAPEARDPRSKAPRRPFAATRSRAFRGAPCRALSPTRYGGGSAAAGCPSCTTSRQEGFRTIDALLGQPDASCAPTAILNSPGLTSPSRWRPRTTSPRSRRAWRNGGGRLGRSCLTGWPTGILHRGRRGHPEAAHPRHSN